MGSPDGTEFESAVRDYLLSEGHTTARRVPQLTPLDTGDLAVDDFTLQAKNWKNQAAALPAGTDGAQIQSKRAGTRFGAAVIKRPRKGVAEAYVVMPLRVFSRLLHSRRSP